jgi:hypothetical protein
VGPEPVLGAVAWLGMAAAVAVAVLSFKQRGFRPYALVICIPGICAALLGVPGQVGAARIAGLSLVFFLIGAVLVGLPLAGLWWLWVRHRSTRRGALQ